METHNRSLFIRTPDMAGYLHKGISQTTEEDRREWSGRAFETLIDALVFGDSVAMRVSGQNFCLAFLLQLFGYDLTWNMLEAKTISFLAWTGAVIEDASASGLSLLAVNYQDKAYLDQIGRAHV